MALELLKPKTAYIHTADANLDLTSGNLPAVSRLIITGSGFSASRDVILPSVGVAAGEVFEIHNRATLYDAVIKASGGTALTVAGGVNIDATIRNGKVVLVALQALPTTPAHWMTVTVSEKSVTASLPVSGAFTGTATGKWSRENNKVFFLLDQLSGTATAAGNIIFSSLPARITPASNYEYPTTPLTLNGTVANGAYRINVSGQIFFWSNASHSTSWAIGNTAVIYSNTLTWFV